MDRVRYTLAVLLSLLSKYVLGEAIAFFPADPRAVNQFQFQPQLQPVNMMPQGFPMPERYARREFSTNSLEQSEPQERLLPILHTSAADTAPPPMPQRPMDGLNYTINENPRMVEEYRAVKAGYDYPAHPAAQPSYPAAAPPYGYPASTSNYSPPAPAAPYRPPPSHPPPAKFPVLKPDLTTLIKPVTTKVATKVSGLIGLVLSLLTGSAPDDLEMKGFKDIVINGIVKPLLIAKGGIKSLISKLTIPVISLLLINLEVLITVWWLWEDCPESKIAYEKPTYTPTYNSYR